MCLNFQLLVLGLTSLEPIHVVLVATAVDNHRVVNLITVLWLTNCCCTTILYLTLNVWISTDSVIVINSRHQPILFSPIVIRCKRRLSTNCTSRCHILTSIVQLLLSKIITLSSWLINVRHIFKLIWISGLLVKRLRTSWSSIIC